MANQTEFLKSIPYFSGLNNAQLDAVREFVFEKTAERGELILLEGESAQALYFIVSGVAKAYKTSAEGKEQILHIIRPGESFNDVPIFDGGPNPASVQAMGSVTLYGINTRNVGVILRNNPQVAMNVNKVLAQRVRNLLSLVEDLSFRHVIGRVAKILLEYTGDGAGPGPRLTQQEMAAMAGTAREMVGRSLRALADDGIVRLDRHRIVITNREALQKMVETPS